MKNTLLLILGYYLYAQAGLGAITACGRPEHALVILLFCVFSGWGGYELIKKARRKPPALPIPETQPLSPMPTITEADLPNSKWNLDTYREQIENPPPVPGTRPVDRP